MKRIDTENMLHPNLTHCLQNLRTHTHIHINTRKDGGGEGVEGDRHGYRPTRAKASQVNALSALIHKYPPPALINYKQSEPIQYCIIIFKQREAKGMYFLIDLFIWRT